jgi:hypothetical protein
MNYQNILEEAHQKGLIALKTCVPTPVSWVTADLNDKPLSAPSAPDEEGECGGAYITGLHGRDPLVSWLKKQGETIDGICTLKKGVYKGCDLYLYKDYHGQSHEKHTAFAKAFAEVLNQNGIKCGVRDYLV